ncbi:MAG: helix-turn-helix transcriptional regulator [Saprospiraceae bacterium]
MQEEILDAFVKVEMPSSLPVLPITSREKELLEHLSRGLLYKEIAALMDITTGTVKQHIHKIYGKLQVQNRTEAINKLKNL